MRELTDRPWGVNIAQMLVGDDDMVAFVPGQGVRFVTTQPATPPATRRRSTTKGSPYSMWFHYHVRLLRHDCPPRRANPGLIRPRRHEADRRSGWARRAPSRHWGCGTWAMNAAG
jgi:hypothetical protein